MRSTALERAVGLRFPLYPVRDSNPYRVERDEQYVVRSALSDRKESHES